MKPKPQDCDAFELFQAHFDQLLNPRHALVPLTRKIDWSHFETALASCGGGLPLRWSGGSESRSKPDQSPGKWPRTSQFRPP